MIFWVIIFFRVPPPLQITPEVVLAPLNLGARACVRPLFPRPLPSPLAREFYFHVLWKYFVTCGGKRNPVAFRLEDWQTASVIVNTTVVVSTGRIYCGESYPPIVETTTKNDENCREILGQVSVQYFNGTAVCTILCLRKCAHRENLHFRHLSQLVLTNYKSATAKCFFRTLPYLEKWQKSGNSLLTFAKVCFLRQFASA